MVVRWAKCCGETFGPFGLALGHGDQILAELDFE
jgi:hypothetical protein